MIKQSKSLSFRFRAGSRALMALAVVLSYSGGPCASIASALFSGIALRRLHQTSARFASTLKADYGCASAEAQRGIFSKALDADQTNKLVELLKNAPGGGDFLTNRINPGVDEAVYVKAAFLTAVARGEAKSPLVSPEKATELLATMQGGYNIATLVELLDHPTLANKAADGLCSTILMFEAFHDVEHKAQEGNKAAKRVMQSWADAEWFMKRSVRQVPKHVVLRSYDMVFDESNDTYDEVLTESAHTLCDREDFRDLCYGGQLRRVSDNRPVVLFGEVVDGDVLAQF